MSRAARKGIPLGEKFHRVISHALGLGRRYGKWKIVVVGKSILRILYGERKST